MFRVKATIIIFLMAHGIFAPNLSQALTPGLGNPDCSSLLLVSSWSKNNVKIYDGCDGHYIRDLDSQKLIEGPLGILLAPDGDLLVISETNGRLLKYDQQTLSRGVVVMGDNPETPVVEDNFIATPSAAILDDKGMMYAASFGSNSVVKIDTSIWKITEQLVKPGNQMIDGIDAGIALSNDGYLYLPGYNSDNIVKVHLKSKSISEVVASDQGQLDAPRSILLYENKLIVSAEKSNAVMEFDINSGKYIKTLLNIYRPTGMQHDGDSHFLINHANAVFRASIADLAVKKIILNGEGELAGGTFVFRFYKK